MKHSRCIIFWALALCFSLMSVQSVQGQTTVTTARLPDGGCHPQTATDTLGQIHLIFFKGDASHGDLFYEHSSDGGRTFSPPIRVNSQPQSVIVIGTVRGPQLAIGKNNRVHIAWMGSSTAEPKAGANAVPLLYTRLNDTGDAFETQRNIIQSHPGLDGGSSLAADDQGNVYVAWHAPDGAPGEVNRRVWISRSSDDGKTFAPETAPFTENTGACGCCGMKIAAASGGRVYVLYRSAMQMIHRDMYLLASDDFGKTFKIITTDPWEVGACVMSTDTLATTDHQLLAAWETHAQIYILNQPTGQSSASAHAVPGATDSRKHPAVAINSRGQYIAVWAEGTGWNKGGSIAWQVFDKDDKPIAGQSGKADGLATWSVPAAFPRADDTFGIIF